MQNKKCFLKGHFYFTVNKGIGSSEYICFYIQYFLFFAKELLLQLETIQLLHPTIIQRTHHLIVIIPPWRAWILQ